MRYLRQGVQAARQGKPAAMLLKRLPWRSPNKESDTLMRCLWERIPAVSPRLRNMLPRMRNSSSSIAQEARSNGRSTEQARRFLLLSHRKMLAEQDRQNGVASRVFRRGTAGAS